MKTALLFALFFVMCMGVSYAQEDEQTTIPCHDMEKAINILQNKGFVPIWVGRSDSGAPRYLVQNKKGIWFLFSTKPASPQHKSGELCSLEEGDHSIGIPYEDNSKNMGTPT